MFIQNDRARLIIEHSTNFVLSGNIDGPCNIVTFNQNDLQMELIQIYVTFSKLAASAITKNGENIKQTISHELPNEFCQNMCHTDAFIEFLM